MSLYALSLGLLMLLALLVSNVPPLSLSFYIDIPFRKYICLGFLSVAGLSGVFTILKHQQRVAEPWRVHQAMVSTLFLVFIFSSVLGVLTLR